MDDIERTRQSLSSSPEPVTPATAGGSGAFSQAFTFELKGVVSLDEYEKAVHHWAAMVRELTAVVARKRDIRWTIEYLMAGSATMTALGEADDPQDLERFDAGYSHIGHDLDTNAPIPFPRKVRTHALALLHLVDASPKISALRFEGKRDNILIFPTKMVRPKAQYLVSFGEIEGVIETLSARRKLGFTIYDSLFDKAVFCSLKRGQESFVADKWERQVSVRGMITRDPTNGRPIEMYDIVSVDAIDDGDEGSDVRTPFIKSLSSTGEDDESAASVLRRLRDEW